MNKGDRGELKHEKEKEKKRGLENNANFFLLVN
jgi:hypothetical protein